MGRVLGLAGLIVVAVMNSAAAGETTPVTNPPNTAHTDPAPDPDDDVVCRRGPPKTGSIVPGAPVCHTRKKWSEIDAHAQDYQSTGALQAGEMIRTH